MPPPTLPTLIDRLSGMTPRIVACSGGIDSMLLATIAHRQDPGATVVAHAISPAVPAESTARVRDWAATEGWDLACVETGEFGSEAYLANPVDRCYHCKRHLYASLDRIADALGSGATLASGANVDDLGEYRPGLVAASEKGVRHPYVECGIGKDAIRAIARDLALPFAELPASPCLASRLYTGTRVSASRLRAIEAAERVVRARTGVDVVRCRIREDAMLVEVEAAHRDRITSALLDAVAAAARAYEPSLAGVVLDPAPYRPGRAFVASP